MTKLVVLTGSKERNGDVLILIFENAGFNMALMGGNQVYLIK